MPKKKLRPSSFVAWGEALRRQAQWLKLGYRAKAWQWSSTPGVAYVDNGEFQEIVYGYADE